MMASGARRHRLTQADIRPGPGKDRTEFIVHSHFTGSCNATEYRGNPPVMPSKALDESTHYRFLTPLQLAFAGIRVALVALAAAAESILHATHFGMV